MLVSRIIEGAWRGRLATASLTPRFDIVLYHDEIATQIATAVHVCPHPSCALCHLQRQLAAVLP